jgi:hypothetical protein
MAVHIRDRLHALFEAGELRNRTQSIDNFVNLAFVTLSEPDDGNIFKTLARDGFAELPAAVHLPKLNVIAFCKFPSGDRIDCNRLTDSH